MTKQDLINRGDEISALNHAIEDAQMETLAIQGELLAASARWAKDAGISAIDFASSMKRIRAGIEATANSLNRAGIVHSDMQSRFEEKMDLAWGSCPNSAEFEEELAPKLKVVGQ